MRPAGREKRSRCLQKVLVANRGEIACRVIRTLDRMGIASVAIHSEVDAGSPHVRAAGEAVCVGAGPVSQSYLRQNEILEVAKACGVDAVHPGYGLLSENAEFAQACESVGLGFVGPTPDQIAAFGRKEVARRLATEAGLPVCPGSDLVRTPEQALQQARALGFPILVKAAAGGGGIGMELCRDEAQLVTALERTRRIAEGHFGRGDHFLERFVEHARHIEVQIFGDGSGEVCSLGLRDCSLQRRRQKVIEESPPPNLTGSLARELEEAACALARSVRYRSAGTVEFLVDRASGAYFFLEVNTRLQVEHGVTELVTGVDLVEWMLRLAGGEAVLASREAAHASGAGPERAPRGHAIQVRLYAEDPGADFQPVSGLLSDVTLPSDVRVDHCVESGMHVSPFYDPLLAKVLVHGPDRASALAAMRRALRGTRLTGIPTNLEYLEQVLEEPSFVEGTHHTRTLEGIVYGEAVLRVREPGAATTIQDVPGRLGYWSVGVPPSGPMDALAFRLVNRIVGNASGEAGFEIGVTGPCLELTCGTVVCVGGASIEAEWAPAAGERTRPIAPRPIAPWRAVRLPAGSRLRLGNVGGDGARSYLAIRGGLDVPAYLGSRATFTLGAFGGHAGRALAAGDVVPLGGPPGAARDLTPPLTDAEADALVEELRASDWARGPVSRDAQAVPGSSTPEAPGTAAPTSEPPRTWVLRVLEGPHGMPEFFAPEDIAALLSEPYEVHHQSARTGVRLVGPRPRWARSDGGDAGLHPSNIHDTAYAVGSLDFTGDMPVILGPDGPSLGGFVCPAVVIAADLWKLGQLRAGDRVHFRAVEIAEALELAERQSALLEARAPRRAAPATVPPSAPWVTPQRRPGVLGRRHAEGELPEVTYRQSGERNLLVEFGACILDLDLRVRVQLLWEACRMEREQGRLSGVVDLTPGVRSLQVQFDPTCVSRSELLRTLDSLERSLPSGDDLRLPTRIVHLPLSWDDPATRHAIEKYAQAVRADAPWCPSNLEFIRRINGLDSIEDVRQIVFDAHYLVLGLGDVYLGAPLATPLDPRHRLVTTKYNPARTWTPENAVGIGGAYLCIYGMEGPGGYQFVGRTVPVWSAFERWSPENAGAPWLLRFFDQIRFFPVSAEELLEWREAVRTGQRALRIEPTVFDVGAYRHYLMEHAESIAAFRTRQQAAFEAERKRWVASGEFEAVDRLLTEAAARIEAVGAEDRVEAPPGGELVVAAFGAQIWEMGVAPGDLVEVGQTLVTLSAMKTETAVTAKVGGVVDRVLCRVGQVVTAGAPLLVLRAARARERHAGEGSLGNLRERNPDAGSSPA